MAQRPVLTSLFAFAIAAAAMRLASGPAVPTSSLGGAGSGGDSIRPKTATSAAAVASWSDQMKRDPRAAGKAAAKEEMSGKICGFVAVPFCSCAPSGDAKVPACPMYSDRPEVMIAIGPDPVQTHLALLFDRLIDSFEDALQDSGWEYQGSWMPWPSQAGAGQENSDLEKREEERLFLSGREEMPGVMLFRPADRRSAAPSDESPQRVPLIVLVVGDSPTSGLDATQFREAEQMFADLTAPGTPLRIMGPDFTGSGPSLRALLKEGKASMLAGRPVTVASGSVSDWRCDHMLPDLKPATALGDDCGGGADSYLSFGDDVRWETASTRDYLIQRGGLHPWEIAELTEDESAFGSWENQKKQVDGDLRLKFPRGISRLRSAYQKNSVWGFGGSSGASSVSLSLDFEEPHHANDSVPVFAPRQMPVSQEGSVAQVAAVLDEHHIKAVLLSATDVLDELFVAQILARETPNLMVIVRGSDVLFLRSGSHSVYHNVYAVSPWPLIPQNSTWSRSREVEGGNPVVREFPSGNAQGAYTAMRYLVGERTGELQDYNSPVGATGRPPLWLSVIGHGAYWPMALINSGRGPDGLGGDSPVERSKINLPRIEQKGSPKSLSGEHIPISEQVMILLALVLSLFHAGKCLDLRTLMRIAPGYGIAEEATRIPKLILQAGITVLGCLMLCLVFSPAERSHPGQRPWSFLFFTAMTVLSLAGAWVAWRLMRGGPLPLDSVPKPYRGGAGKIGTQLALAALIFGSTLAVWHLLWLWLPAKGASGEGLREFFFFRAQHPLSGASPVFPLLIALQGVTLVLFSYLGRLSFSPKLSPRLPTDVAAIPNCPGEIEMEPVSDLLRWPLPGVGFRGRLKGISKKLGLFLMVMTACLVVTVAMQLAPEMLESTALQVALRCAMFLLLLGICWDLMMGALLWSRLKRTCLDPLESSSLRRGFSSICGLTWKSLWLMPQTASAEYRALLRALEQTTRQIMDAAATQPMEGGSLETVSNRMWNQVRFGMPQGKVIETFGEVQQRLATVAEDLLLALKYAWAQEVGRITAADAPQAKEEAKGFAGDQGASTARVRQLAEEWVALIYIHYIRMVLIQVRSRLMTAALLYVLLVWSVTCYPFLNRHVLMIALSVVLGLLAFVVTSTYASINKDAILSRTTENEPGKLDLDFYAKTASMVGIPLLGFVASQFPEVSSFLFSWLEPGIAAVK